MCCLGEEYINCGGPCYASARIGPIQRRHEFHNKKPFRTPYIILHRDRKLLPLASLTQATLQFGQSLNVVKPSSPAPISSTALVTTSSPTTAAAEAKAPVVVHVVAAMAAAVAAVAV